MIYSYCGRNNIEASTIKRNGCYFTLSLIKKGDRMQKIEFRDVLNFSSPTSLDRYLKQWNVALSKSIFPYSYYKSVEELSRATEFPPPEAFYNDLRNTEVDHNLYDIAKEEFNRRKNLPDNHKEKVNTPIVCGCGKQGFLKNFKLIIVQAHTLCSMVILFIYGNIS